MSKMSQYTIKVVPKDASLSELQNICAQMQPEVWGKDNDMSSYKLEELKKFLAEGHILVLVCDKQKIIGAATAYKLLHPSGDHHLYVHELDTHPDYRRQGVASQIINELKQITKQHMFSELWLGTESDNTAANALYKSLDPYEVESSVIYAYKVSKQ